MVDEVVARKISESSESEIIESLRRAQLAVREAALSRLRELGLEADHSRALAVLDDEAPLVDLAWQQTGTPLPIGPADIGGSFGIALFAWLVLSKAKPEWFDPETREVVRLLILLVGGTVLLLVRVLAGFLMRARNEMRVIVSLKSIRICSAHRWVTLARDEIRSIRLRRRGERWVLNVEAQGASEAIVLGQNRDEVMRALRENGLVVDTL